MLSKVALGLALAGAAYAAPDQILKRDGSGGHSHDHGHSSGGGGHAAPAPSGGYSAPSGGYSAPASSYGAPESSYGAPESSYGAPDTGYGAPSYGGGHEVYGYEDDKKFDISVIIIPLLIVLGLSLLFPATVNISTGRKRREAGEASGLLDVVERVNDIYGSVMESEECMERIACEVGGLAADVGLNQVTRMAEPFAPKKYSKYMKQFSKGKDCHKIKCGNLF